MRFQKGGAMNINDEPFPKHQDMGTSHGMTASHAKRDVEGDAPMQPGCEPDVDKMA